MCWDLKKKKRENKRVCVVTKKESSFCLNLLILEIFPVSLLSSCAICNRIGLSLGRYIINQKLIPNWKEDLFLININWYAQELRSQTPDRQQFPFHEETLFFLFKTKFFQNISFCEQFTLLLLLWKHFHIKIEFNTKSQEKQDEEEEKKTENYRMSCFYDFDMKRSILQLGEGCKQNAIRYKSIAFHIPFRYFTEIFFHSRELNGNCVNCVNWEVDTGIGRGHSISIEMEMKLVGCIVCTICSFIMY